jgi:hypothetical protein
MKNLLLLEKEKGKNESAREASARLKSIPQPLSIGAPVERH